MIKPIIKFIAWIIAKLIISINLLKAKINLLLIKDENKEENLNNHFNSEVSDDDKKIEEQKIEEQKIEEQKIKKQERAGAQNVKPSFNKIIQAKKDNKDNKEFAKQFSNKPTKDKSKEDKLKDLQQKKKNTEGFADSVSKDSNLVYLVKGKDGDRPAWHYVLVDKNKLHIFLKETQGGTVDVSDYGKVIKSGWGEEPSQEIVDSIEKEYGS